MTVIVTRNVAPRYRGFLASCMLEIAPGVYTSPRMSAAVRRRVWNVLQDWWGDTPGGSIVLTWRNNKERSGQSVLTLGVPPVRLVEVQGIILSQKAVNTSHEDL
jgi:CRISPR-associated protein Cas2